MKNKFNVSGLSKFIDMEDMDPNAEVERKGFSSKISISSDEERTCTATISTMAEDSDGDVIMPDGCDMKRFMKNPVIMYAHNYAGKPVAKAVAIKIDEEGIHAKMQFADTQEALEVWSLVKGGFLNANSIGFVIKECHRKGTESFNNFVKANKIKVKETCNRIINKFELLESSIVPIPANPEALMQAISAKSINISDKLIKDLDLIETKSIDMDALAELIAKKLQAKEVKEEPKVELVEALAGEVVGAIIEEVVDAIAEEVLEVPKVVVVEPIIPAPVIVNELVEFSLVDEIIELTEEEKESIIAEVEEEIRKMAQGKIL